MRASLIALFMICGLAAHAEPLGDPDNGKVIFGQCSGCHMVGPDARDRVGPHLNGLFDRAAGAHEGYRYSQGMTRAAAGGLEWHADTIAAYVADPRALISGTRMAYPGLKDPGDRADLLAYLRIYSDDPGNIPEADPTALGTDHDVDPEILALVGDPEYGEFLSSECKTCHQVSGAANGIPSITLWPEEDFVIAMHAYKDEVRSHPVMTMIAGRLNAEEIAALAAYFGSLEP